MGHGNARLTVHGRRLLVSRVRDDGMPVAHVAKAMGVSRQCAHRWVARFDQFGDAGLVDRSSRPLSCPTRTKPDVESKVVAARRAHRKGPDWLSVELGVPARTVTRILRRHGMPRLCECDPLTGDVIRASRSTGVRYERERPGELVHMDVKKIGKIPDGGGWRVHGRDGGANHPRGRLGYDYIHSIVDDHSRVAYSEILSDEKADTVVAFVERAIVFFAGHGVVIERVMTDNAFAYRNSNKLAKLLADHHITHKFIRPHCPWQNGKVERFNRTLQTEWAYRTVYLTNAQRTDALAPWLDLYNTRRRHSALGGQPPINRLSPT